MICYLLIFFICSFFFKFYLYVDHKLKGEPLLREESLQDAMEYTKSISVQSTQFFQNVSQAQYT